MAQQTTMATNLAEMIVNNNGSWHVPPELKLSMAALKLGISGKDEFSSPGQAHHDIGCPAPSEHQFELLSVTLAMKAIQQVRGKTSHLPVCHPQMLLTSVQLHRRCVYYGGLSSKVLINSWSTS